MSNLFLGSNWSVKDKSLARSAGRNAPDDVVIINEEKGASVHHPHPYISLTGYNKSDHVRAERTARLIKSSLEMHELLCDLFSSENVSDEEKFKVESVLKYIKGDI